MSAIPLTTITQAEFSGWLETQTPVVQNWLAANQFKGAANEWCALPGADGTLQGVVCGAGDQRHIWTLGRLPSLLAAGEYELQDDWSQPVTALMALGFELGRYSFDRYLEPAAERPTLRLPAAAADDLEAQAEAVALVRDLVNTPTEHMGPAELALAIRRSLRRAIHRIGG